jgi:hypothetical protein
METVPLPATAPEEERCMATGSCLLPRLVFGVLSWAFAGLFAVSVFGASNAFSLRFCLVLRF